MMRPGIFENPAAPQAGFAPEVYRPRVILIASGDRTPIGFFIAFMDFLLLDYFIMSEKPTYEELEHWKW